MSEAPNDNELEKRIDQYFNRVTDAGQNVIAKSLGNANGLGAAVAYFTDDSPIAITKSERDQLSKLLGRKSHLPAGYKQPFVSFSDYLRKGYRRDSDWYEGVAIAAAQYERAGSILKANAYNSIDSESAAALVLPEFAPEIADILYQTDDLFGQTDSYTISGDGIKLPKIPQKSRKTGQRHSGVTAGWPDQGDVLQTTRGKIESTDLSLKKMAVVVFLNNELLADASYALEKWVKTSVSSEMKFLLNDSMINGVGGGMPLGYMESKRTILVKRQTAGTIESADVLKMFAHRIPGVPLSEYEWHINQEAEQDLQQLTLGTAGSQLAVYVPNGGLSAAPYSTLMGLRVRTLECANARGSKGDLALVRMKGMCSIQKGGINEMASSHVSFLRDQEAIRFTMRVDARPMYDTPTEAYKGSAGYSYSDFIALDLP